MKANKILFTAALLAVSLVPVSAFPPGGVGGVGWARGASFRNPIGGMPLGRSGGLFAGNVVLVYDLNGDGDINIRDNSKSFVLKKATTPGVSLRPGALLKVGFEALAGQPAKDPRTVRNPNFRDYKTIAGLEIKGINLLSRSGKFASTAEEASQCGRVLVWLDASRRELVLDSADPSRCYIEWHLSEGPVPQFVYVQIDSPGRPGGAFRLTGSVDDSNQNLFSHMLFGRRTAYDHIIFNAIP